MYKLVQRFIECSNFSDNTARYYEIHLRNFLSYVKKIGITKYTDITTSIIRTYTLESKTPSTKNARLSAIRGFFDFLIEEDITKFQPVTRSLYTKNVRQFQRKISPFTETEITLFLEYISSQMNTRIQLGFNTLFATGIRISELLSITPEDIFVHKKKISLKIKQGKWGNSRIVPIFWKQTALELLEIDTPQENKIFPFSRKAFAYYIDRFSRITGKKYTIHQIRYTFATQRLEEGIRLDILQKILGHASIQTTLHYAHTLDADIIASGPDVL